jgi:hypothetical protein
VQLLATFEEFIPISTDQHPLVVVGDTSDTADPDLALGALHDVRRNHGRLVDAISESGSHRTPREFVSLPLPPRRVRIIAQCSKPFFKSIHEGFEFLLSVGLLHVVLTERKEMTTRLTLSKPFLKLRSEHKALFLTADRPPDDVCDESLQLSANGLDATRKPVPGETTDEEHEEFSVATQVGRHRHDFFDVLFGEHIGASGNIAD